jgi:hypothetical protein
MPHDHEVGSRKPPKHSQFKKGQSGNPKGRPKGSKNLRTDLHEELQEKVMVTERGRQRAVSKQRAMVKTIMSKALGGDARTLAILSDLAMRLLDQEDETAKVSLLSADDQAILEDFETRIKESVDGSSRNGEV